MYATYFGLQEMPESSCRDFLYKPIDHIYTKSSIKLSNEKFYALQSVPYEWLRLIAEYVSSIASYTSNRA